MIHVAICDDDQPLTGIVEQLLLRIASEQCIDIHCEVFFDGASLLKAAAEQQMGFDLIYLDIEMGDMNGINTALALREKELPAKSLLWKNERPRRAGCLHERAFPADTPIFSGKLRLHKGIIFH